MAKRSARRFVWLAVGAIAVASGCDDGTVAPTPDGDGSEVASRRADTPTDYAIARPRKGTVIGGEKVARTIAWPDAAAIDAPTRQRLSAAVHERLAAAPLPVLVPGEGAEGGELFVGDTWYAYSAQLRGARVSIQGSAQARVHGHIEAADPTETIRGVGGFVSSNESIWTLSWIENGAAYSLELECDDPEAPPCADPDRAMALAESMVFVGGGQDR